MLLTEVLTNDEINNALKLTGVDHLKNDDLRNLSGGEFQRVLIARAISKKPDLLVLDEPVQGVDFKGELALYELIKGISEKLGCGILLISHDYTLLCPQQIMSYALMDMCVAQELLNQLLKIVNIKSYLEIVHLQYYQFMSTTMIILIYQMGQ